MQYIYASYTVVIVIGMNIQSTWCVIDLNGGNAFPYAAPNIRVLC